MTSWTGALQPWSRWPAAYAVEAILKVQNLGRLIDAIKRLELLRCVSLLIDSPIRVPTKCGRKR